MKTACIIPALNEEATIGEVLKETMKYVDDVVIVDDGSSDRTADIARGMGAHVVRHQMNKGVGAAFSTGVKEVLKMGADVVVTLDADGQFRPEEIPLLIAPILNDEVDFVTGSRFLNDNTIPESTWTKRFGNKLFTRIINKLIGSHFTDTQCGFRAYSREALLRLTIFGKFTYTQEVFLDLANKNMRMKEIAIQVKPRRVGKSKVVKNPVHYGLRALKIILQYERDFRPLRFFSMIGLAFLLPGLAMLLFVFVNWLLTGMSSPYTSLISIGGILTLVAIIFLILALIADMNGRQRLLQEELLYLMRKQSYEQGRGGNNS
jgi:glycosyltransferase involved in cell wall biosynthesis